MTEKWKQKLLKEVEGYVENCLLPFELRLRIVELKRASREWIK